MSFSHDLFLTICLILNVRALKLAQQIPNLNCINHTSVSGYPFLSIGIPNCSPDQITDSIVLVNGQYDIHTVEKTLFTPNGTEAISCTSKSSLGSETCEYNCWYRHIWNETKTSSVTCQCDGVCSVWYAEELGDIEPDCFCEVYDEDVYGYWFVDQYGELSNMTVTLVQVGLKKVEYSPLFNDSSTVDATLVEKTVYISVDPVQSTYLIFRKDGWIKALRPTPDKVLTFELPDEVISVSGTLFLEVHLAESQHNFNFSITGVKFCRLKDCLLCYDAIANYSCLPTFPKIFLTVLLIASFLLVFVLVPPVILGFKYIFHYSKRLFCCCFRITKGLSQKYTRRMKDKLTELEMESLESGNISRTDLSKKSSPLPTSKPSRSFQAFKPKRKVAHNPFLGTLTVETPVSSSGESSSSDPDYSRAFLLILLLLPICLGQEACSSSVDSTASITQCVKDKGGKTQSCILTTLIEGTLKQVKETSCISLYERNSTKPIAKLTATLIDVKERLLLNRLYYTAGWGMQCVSSAICPSNGDQCSLKKCENVNPLDPDPFGVFSGYQDVDSTPGWTVCRYDKVKGCLGYSSGCIWGRVIAGANWEVFSVDEIIGVVYDATVEFTLSAGAGKYNATAKLSGNTESIFFDRGQLLVDVVAIHPTSVNSFGDNKIIRNSNTTWLQEASPRNAPTRSTIGDIQGVSPEKFARFSGVDAYIMDKSIFSFHEQPSKWICHSSQPGIQIREDSRILPLTRGQTLWTNEHKTGNVIGTPLTEYPLTYKINIPGSYAIQMTINTVCPSGTLGKITACRNCNAGFKAELQLTSKCGPGVVKVTATDKSIVLLTTSLVLSEKEETYYVTGETFAAQNDFDLIIHGVNAKDLKIHLSFAAPEAVTLRKEMEFVDVPFDYADDDGDGGSWFNPSKWWNDAKNWFEGGFGGGSWLHTLITVLIIVGVGFLILLLLPVMINILRSVASSVKPKTN